MFGKRFLSLLNILTHTFVNTVRSSSYATYVYAYIYEHTFGRMLENYLRHSTPYARVSPVQRLPYNKRDEIVSGG